MFKLNGMPIDIRLDLTLGEGDAAITYPAASLQDAATRAEIGITDEPDPVRPDDRFYIVHGDGEAVARPLADVLALLWEYIKAFRDQLQESGCPVGEDWFHNDVKSRTQWERMATRAVGMEDADPYLVDGTPVIWKTIGGASVSLTAGKIREVVTAFEVREVRIFAQAEAHRSALAAMQNVEEMIAYDWRSGWPEELPLELRQ